MLEADQKYHYPDSGIKARLSPHLALGVQGHGLPPPTSAPSSSITTA
jgi:hypothetical protein